MHWYKHRTKEKKRHVEKYEKTEISSMSQPKQEGIIWYQNQAIIRYEKM